MGGWEGCHKKGIEVQGANRQKTTTAVRETIQNV